MNLMDFSDASPVILTIAVFLARVVDVAIGTVRTILLVRGHRAVAATLGFFEILIWLSAAGLVLGQLDRWYLAIAYAGGFAVGNLVGGWIEGRLALGFELIRAISQDPGVQLAPVLTGDGREFTLIPGRDPDGTPVEVLLVVEKRRHVPRLLRRLMEADPQALFTVSEVRRGAALPPARFEGRRRLFADWISTVKKK